MIYVRIFFQWFYTKLALQNGLNSSNVTKGIIKKIVVHGTEITIVDIGANIGEFGKLCRSEYKGARIIAVEPQVLCHDEILKNCGLETVIIGKVASSVLGLTSFEISEEKDRKGHIQNDKIGYESSRLRDYEKITVDEIILEYKIDFINLLKIDTEGHDFEVLKGARSALSQGKIGNILFEIMPRLIEYRTKPEEIEKYLRTFGYAFFYRSTPHLGLLRLEKLTNYELHTQNIIASKKLIK
jgi:FkbM family methyltransferase